MYYTLKHLINLPLVFVLVPSELLWNPLSIKNTIHNELKNLRYLIIAHRTLNTLIINSSTNLDLFFSLTILHYKAAKTEIY